MAAAVAGVGSSIIWPKRHSKFVANPSQSSIQPISNVNERKKEAGIGSYSMPIVLNVRLEARAAINPQNPISQFFENEDDDDFIREECGVVGIYGDPEAARLCYLALHALQHRGQEGAGIVTATDGRLQSITGVGLVADVFDASKLNQLPGSLAIGHVRYSTAGSSMLKNVQPFVAGYRSGFYFFIGCFLALCPAASICFKHFEIIELKELFFSVYLTLLFVSMFGFILYQPSLR